MDKELNREQKNTCLNCKHYGYSMFLKCHICTTGHLVTDADWRKEYNVCDKWEQKK